MPERINIQQIKNRIDTEEAETRIPQHSARMLLKCVAELQDKHDCLVDTVAALDKRLRILEENHAVTKQGLKHKGG